MTDRVRLDIDGAIATITNDNPAKHNAFDDEMDLRLFEILDELSRRPEARAMAETVAAAPAVAVKLARRVVSRLARSQQRASMDDELIYQTFLNRSDDFAEMKAARAESREPRYTGS